MAHKNPSGMHNRVKAILMNARETGHKPSGNLIALNEDTYRYLKEAYDYILELGYVPETFWKYNELYDVFRNECVTVWNKTFKGKYLENFPMSNNKLNYIYKRKLMNVFEQHLKHFATEYFVQTIAYWMYQGWKIQESDLYSSIPELERMGVLVATKPWIVRYNESLEENNEE